MRIIRTGGINWYIDKNHSDYNKFGRGGSLLTQIRDDINARIAEGKQVAIVSAAKPTTNFYNEHITESGIELKDVEVFGQAEKDITWEDYSVIVLLGGSSAELLNWLIGSDFSLERLTNCELLAGDSAGAYVLGKDMMFDYSSDGSELIIKKGLMLNSNLIVAGHINNPKYHSDELANKLKKYAKENELELLLLKENQAHEEDYNI